MFDVELVTEVPKLFIVKLSIIVNDDNPREAKSTDDGLPYELSSFGLSDLDHRLSFYPFDEVVDGYKQKLSLCWGRRKGSKYVDPPLGKRSWCTNRLGRLVLHGGVPRASVTPLHMFNVIFVYGQSIISLSEYFVGEGLATEVIAAYSFINLP